MEQAGKLLNRKITPENTPPMLLSYRNADLTQEKNITERVIPKAFFWGLYQYMTLATVF